MLLGLCHLTHKKESNLLKRARMVNTIGVLMWTKMSHKATLCLHVHVHVGNMLTV